MTSEEPVRIENRNTLIAASFEFRFSTFVFRLLIAQRHHESGLPGHVHNHNKQTELGCLFNFDHYPVQF